jgi:GH18 family chitinase
VERRAGSFITYEDPESIRVKMDYAKDRGLGGVMFWELSQDPDGTLLEAIRTGWR